MVLKRKIQKMPEEIRIALAERDLTDDFYKRPDYQQNDYTSWITRAKREETRLRRLNQMLDELDKGGVYMKMDHQTSAK